MPVFVKYSTAINMGSRDQQQQQRVSAATLASALQDITISSGIKKPGTSGKVLVSDQALEFKLLSDSLQKLLVQYIDDIAKHGDDPIVNAAMVQNPEKFQSFIRSMLDLPDEADPQRIQEIFEMTLKYSVKTWSPHFMDKLYAGSNAIGAVSDFLISVLNSNAHVYHVSPVFTLIEIRMLKELGALFGFEDGHGIFCPGGSYSNLHAMITARNLAFPECIEEGNNAPCAQNSSYKFSQNRGPYCVFTSAHSHYSIMKSAISLGIGKKYVYRVPVDAMGRMRVEDLKRLIQQAVDRDERPFFIGATAGTTVLGAFDPIDDIVDIAREYGCWMHVDGSWGASIMFSRSDKPKLLMKGIDRVDSVVINPHKLLGVPLLCSALVTRDPLALKKALSLKAGYLFHGNQWDLGDHTIGCGRRPDSFKFFTSWVYYGKDGFAKRVDTALDNAEYLTSLVENVSTWQGSFELVTSPSFTNVCFWYYPPLKCFKALKSASHQYSSTKEYLKSQSYSQFMVLLTNITRKIHDKLYEEGSFMIDYSPLTMFDLKGESFAVPMFWRVVFNHPGFKKSDVDAFMKKIDEYGSSIMF